MRRALSGKADLRHSGLSANRRRRTGRAPDRAGLSIRAGVPSEPSRQRAHRDGGRLCRRERGRAPQSAARLQALADEGRIELVIPYQLHAIEGAQGQLSAVIVADLAGQTRRLAADSLLPFFGLATDLGPLASWQLDLDNHRIRVDPATCATSRPGIFAIGDIATYPGKLKLILSGFAEAALAAHAIHPLVHPGEALHFEYSTMKGVPGR